MATTDAIAPPSGFVDDYAPPSGFVEDVAPPSGFVEDASTPKAVTPTLENPLAAVIESERKKNNALFARNAASLVPASTGNGMRDLGLPESRYLVTGPEGRRATDRLDKYVEPSSFQTNTNAVLSLSQEPIVEAPQISDETLKSHPVLAGATQGAVNFVSGLTSPQNIALLVGMGGAPAIIQKAIMLGFTAEGAHSIYEQSKALAHETDPAKKSQQMTEIALNAAMLGLGAHGVFEGKPIVTPELRAKALSDSDAFITARKAEEIGATETAKAAAETTALPDAKTTESITPSSEPRIEPQPSVAPVEDIRTTAAVEPVKTEGGSSSGESLVNSASDVRDGMQGMARGVTDALYDTLFQKLQNGDTTEAGQPSSVLQKAKPLFDSGVINSPSELKSWVQDGQKPQPEAIGTSNLTAPVAKNVSDARNMGDTSEAQPFLDQQIERSRAKGDEAAAVNFEAAKAELSKPSSLATSETPATSTPERIQQTASEATSNDWTKATLPSIEEKPSSNAAESSQPIGISPPGTAQIISGMEAVAKAGKAVAAAIKNVPKFHDFRKSVLNWSARAQQSSGEIMRVSSDIAKSVPDSINRDGITNWIQAGGDLTELANRAAASKNLKLQKGYEAALKLTPEEIKVAEKIRDTYSILLNRANAHGIEISEIENYVNQIWKRQPLRDFAASSNRKLSTSIRFAKQRYYDSFFHGEQNGLKPETKDIAKLLPIYINEVNNAINAKQFVAELAKGKAADGRPLVAPRGSARTIDGNEGKVHLVFPENATKETADYRVVEQPALHDWRWRGEDEAGNPIMVKGDLAVHPDAVSHLQNVLGQSAIKEWYRSPSENALADIPKAAVKFLADDVQQIAKATMLGFLSPFHQVQEGTHAIGHKVNPFSNIPKIDLDLPTQQDATAHGLMLLPDRISAQQFREGLDGSNRNIAANIIGKLGKPGAKVKEWADGYQDYLFHEYIPGLKLKTYDHILDRNQKRYVDEIAKGDVSLDQVKYLSAQQANAAYGHLNYADMGRNPTLQHLAQTLLLAPDFLEARTRFTGQAIRGTVSKAGREQLAAIATLAAVQYVGSRIINQLLDDDPHWNEPFGVIVGNRRYTMRSVPEDIYKAFSDSRRFISGRLSPLVGKGLLEGLSGVNYRSEPTTIGETLTNIVSGFVPLTLQPATRGLSETGKDNPVSPIEQLIGSLGLHVSRFSPVSEVYHLSKEWTEKHGKEYGLDQRRAVFPVSQYQQLRYALEDSDTEKAKTEINGLLKKEKIERSELDKRFKMSINHPFTGSTETDKVFKKSLNPRGQKVFDAAMKRRETLISRFQSVH